MQSFKQIRDAAYSHKVVFKAAVKLQFHLRPLFLCSSCDFAAHGGRKFSPVITFLPVLASSSRLAFLAIPPPLLPATLFSSIPVASIVSAICRVESSARRSEEHTSEL